LDQDRNYWDNLNAVAYVMGGPLRPQISGVVFFRDTIGGTWVSVQITGLPDYKPATATESPVGPHGFHVHENGVCEVGDPNDPFLAAGGHWNPTNQPHGNHAGDFPVLFSNHGRAVIIHNNPDDYRTQPAGNSGKRLACGVIQWARY